jgi:hypothetical protein
MTATEKLIQDLKGEVVLLKEQVETLQLEVEPTRQIMSRLAVIEHKLEVLVSAKEEWGKRGWAVLLICFSFFMSLVAGILSSLLTFLGVTQLRVESRDKPGRNVPRPG